MEASLPPLKGVKVLAVGAMAAFARTRQMEELFALCEAAGADVTCMAAFGLRRRGRSGFEIGDTSVLENLVFEAQAEAVVIDDELSPARHRDLEEKLGVEVIDRTGLILRIFSERAKSREAMLQVKLARHEYVLPRLAGMWTHLDKVRGGIGLKGVGEKQIELDRRILRREISKIKKQLEQIESQRLGARQKRTNRDIRMHVAIVGYTNAGKTSLMQMLAADVEPPKDQLFATLHPVVRKARLAGGGEYYLIDTVGFVERLPDMLVTAFRASLQDVTEADLLLHVIDASDPDIEAKVDAVEEILDELGAGEKPMLYLLNKSDLCTAQQLALATTAVRGDRIEFSCQSGAGQEALDAWLVEQLTHACAPLDVEIPYGRLDLWELARRYGINIAADWVDSGIVVHGWIPKQYRTAFNECRAV